MRAFVATAAFLALSLSAASSFADEACFEQVRDLRERCENRGGGNGCWDTYRTNMERCHEYDRRARERQIQMERANRGETTGIGNFQSIPQRPTYVLPGMR